MSNNEIQKIKKAAIIILGASGDLAHRKLLPALSKLYDKGEIDASSIIIGSGRKDMSNDEFQSRVNSTDEFKKILLYHQGIKGLKELLISKGGFDTIIVFLALPPVVYGTTIHALRDEGFDTEIRIVLEKPFGYDYASAHKLNEEITTCFNENQIYRIDHYLAKEAVQNILVFRFANAIFSPVWNSRYIESIQINAFESIGIENRGAYFDNAGIIRDMVQNHLIQLLCLLTMEAPISLIAEEIRNQKINILKTLRVKNCMRYQYNGYREEDGVKSDSTTETYAEMELEIFNMRWAGTPIYIRAGKATNRKGTEIGVKFKSLPGLLYNENGNLEQNKIIFKIQPAEGIVLDLSSKIPGEDIKISNTNMNFCYRDSFAGEIPEAYQKLLLDALKGDRTLFVSADETELSWKQFDRFLCSTDIEYYDRGTIPEVSITKNWIDFEKFASICT